MSAPLSLDLRHRFRQCLEAGLSGREAARRLLISPATASRLARKIRAGASLEPARTGRPVGTGKLAPYHDFLRELVEQDGDITLAELRDALLMAEGVRVHHTSISQALRRLGFTYKKSAGGNRARQASCAQGKSGMAGSAPALHAHHAGKTGVS